MFTDAWPDGWENSELGVRIARVVGGGTPSRNVPGYWRGDVPWASVKDFDDDRYLITDTKEHISKTGVVNSATNVIESHTPLICTRMAVGRASLAEVPVAVNQDVKALYPKDSLTAKFLIHLLTFVRPHLEALSIGSTVKGLSVRDLMSLRVNFPSVEEQRRIAEILDTTDRAIGETEALISKLKQMKAGLMHDLLTRGLDKRGQLRDPEAHPEQFKDSPLGRIPREWNVRPLAELADLDRGKFAHRPRNDPRFYGGQYPFIQTGDVTGADGGLLNACVQTLNDRGAAVSREFPAKTMAITIAANIADTAILARPMYFPDSVVGAVVKSPNEVRFVELVVRRAKPRLYAQAPQSAQKNINLQDLRPLLVAVPSPGEQRRITEVYDAHDARIRAEEAYRDKLKLQKKGLMEDLLTGRVRVKTAQGVGA